MGKFKSGLFLGGLLGAGLVWLSTTKKGREMRSQVLDYAADVYVKLKAEILKSKTYKNMNRNEYVKLVKEYVDKYAVQNGLAENVKNVVVRLVSSQWNKFKDELK